ncbi:hypothetical protein PG994_014941 [Apiospora phragmitis]|uniref:Spindle pole body-associated protein cut12 domain-containing protein n=1 Tax=Apiospora phragmitis TaxID=2905665 RepID=A0ABR1SV26_9PEZI
MLGWAIKRGYQTATGASDAPRQPEDADTTQLDAPDTPAPIFAARAVRHAIFGTPAPATTTSTVTRPPRLLAELADNRPRSPPKSPPKPTGILMTPGTATSRRKRVSFGYEIQHKQNDAAAQSPSKPPAPKKDEDMSDEDWEDEDPADVTIDLNEPKSNSGRYWKTQFTKYHDDAREEMSKLVKHKHLSRMYAQQKDIENTELQERVKELERQVRLKDEEIKQAQKRPALTRTTSVASASSREREDAESRAAERARQAAERESGAAHEGSHYVEERERRPPERKRDNQGECVRLGSTGTGIQDDFSNDERACGSGKSKSGPKAEGESRT